MTIEILSFYHIDSIHWLSFCLHHFGFWIVTEKWWSHGNEFVIGIRLGSKVWERRWGR